MRYICLILVLTLAGCGVTVPSKYKSAKIPVCEKPSTSFLGVPYTRESQSACVAAVAPFDLGIWHEAPYNSHKVRGTQTVKLGCQPLVPGADDCDYTGLPGNSQTMVMQFDPSVYPESARVRRAVLAVYAFANPQGLYDVHLRGRQNVGDELQSLARQREVVLNNKQTEGWFLFDVTAFAARAINERRNSVHFEISQSCRAEQAPVTAGLLKNEPRLVVEFE